MASFCARLAALTDGLAGRDLVQAQRLHDELVHAGLDDPRRLLAVGGADGEEVFKDIFDDGVPSNVVVTKFAALWAAAAPGAAKERKRRYPDGREALADFTAVWASRAALARE